MDEPVRVLHVDDDPDFGEVAASLLHRADDALRVESETDVSRALDRLADGEFDCVVSDYDMPVVDGLEFLSTVRERWPDLPFILFTGQGSESIASEAVSAGVTDYIQKEVGTDHFEVLANRIENVVAQYRAERAVERTRKRYQTLIEASDAVIFVVDEAASVRYPSPSVGRSYGYDPAELEGTSFLSLLHPDDRDAVEGLLTTLAADPAASPTVQARLRHADGAWRTVEVRGRNLSDEPAVDGLVVYVRDISDRVREQELVERILEVSPVGIVVFSATGEVLRVNRRAEAVTGYTEEQLVSGEVDPMDWEVSTANGVPRDPDDAVHRRVVDTGEPVHDEEVVYRRPDGEERVLSVSGAPLREEDGSVARAVLAFDDVTETRRAERERRLVLERMTDAFFAVDDEWGLTYVNEGAQSILETAMGRPHDGEDLRGLHLWDEIPAAVDTPFYEHYTRAMETQEPVTFEEYYEPMSTWFSVHAYPSETGLSVYFRDVTERKRAEISRQRSYDALQELYRVSADRSTSFDAKLERLLETGREYLDVSYGFLTRIEDDEQTVVAAVGTEDHGGLHRGSSCPLEEAYCRRTIESAGVTAVVDAAAEGWVTEAAYERFELGCYVGARVVVDDELYGTLCFADPEPRTEPFTAIEETPVELFAQWVSYELSRERARDSLEREKQQLEEFASIVSHDIRTPLNTAIGSVDLAAEECDSPHIARADRALDRISELVEDILALSRSREELDEDVVDVADLARRAWSTMSVSAGTLEVREGLRPIRAEETHLRQLLENLLGNAVEHGPEGVTVTVGPLADGFYVADDGPGLPPEIRDTVFQRGVTTSDDGVGLGLYIVREVARTHGWSVTAVESDAGGARFEVTDVDFAPEEG